MQVFRPNDAPTQPHRNRPGGAHLSARLPTARETRRSTNVLFGSP